jgi:hypothetical protein
METNHPNVLIENDGERTELERFDDVRATRYAEVFLIHGDPPENLQGEIYNTTGLNDAPPTLMAALDLDALKQQYGVLGVFVNGPRLWTLDWSEVPLGAERDFNGLKARWVARVVIPKGVDLEREGSTAYAPTTVERKTQFGFDKGKPVFILDDPDGQSWVMKSCGLIVDPTMSYEKLMTLGERLRPAAGWKYRVQVELEEELILKPEGGVAGIVQDELGNTYDLAGPGYSNYKP